MVTIVPSPGARGQLSLVRPASGLASSSRPYQTVANEVRRLQAADLVVVRTVGRSKLLRANEGSPYFGPLSQLALMSFGPPLVIGEEFGDLVEVSRVLIFGSWAARYLGESGPAPNDVDVLLIGEPDRDAVYEAARRAEQRLGWEVNVTVRTAEQWQSATDGFIRQVRSSPLLEIPLRQDQEGSGGGGDEEMGQGR